MEVVSGKIMLHWVSYRCERLLVVGFVFAVNVLVLIIRHSSIVLSNRFSPLSHSMHFYFGSCLHSREVG